MASTPAAVLADDALLIATHISDVERLLRVDDGVRWKPVSGDTVLS